MTDINEAKALLEPMGGPAFPFKVTTQSVNGAPVSVEIFTGLSARDYFAAAALTGLLAQNSDPSNPYMLASRSYKIADCMIVERK